MKHPWYYRSWFILPLLFFCLPIGLIFMWLGRRYPLWARWTLTGVFGLFWMAALVSSPEHPSHVASSSSSLSSFTEPSAAFDSQPIEYVQPPKTKEQDKPIEYKLALLESGLIPQEGDLIMARFKTLLEMLSGKFVESPIEISDATVMAQKLLREKGIEESLLNMMEGINRMFYQKLENQKYDEYILLYMNLRVQGQSHEEAVRGLTAALQAMLRS